MKTLHKKQFPGFTVIELMIVLVIVAILLAIAYPSYVNYTRKAKRGEAQQLLMNWSINQEIWRSNNPIYAPTGPNPCVITPTQPCLTPTHQDGLYDFTARLTMGTPATCAGGAADPSNVAYWLEAAATGDQVNDVGRNGDSCATLCMSSAGEKEPAACWN
jgi:type IV pilus assembly protein PilE